MSEIENEEIDLDALEDNIQETLDEKPKETGDEEQEIEEFDIDEALESFAPISLEGKITEEQAIAKATERGWREDGKDKYGHQISAIEFLERTPLFHKMSLMSGDVEELKKQNKRIIEQSKLIAKKAVEENAKHVAELKAAKEKLLSANILDADDVKELKHIDKQLEDAPKSEDDTVSQYEEAKEVFVQKNDWYGSNRAMTALADKVGVEYANEYLNKHGVLPEPDDTFNYVLDEVKKDFPTMGKQQRTTKVAQNNNRTVTSIRSKKKTLDDIPEDQRPIAKMVMESAGLTEDEYLATYEF